MSVLAVIPSDPMSAYEAVGCHVWAERYYNPGECFEKVYLLSPLEKYEIFQYGMLTIPTRPKDLPHRLRKLDADVVRAYGGYWACDMACKHKTRGIPVVISVHDTNPRELHDSIRRADYVFCMSEAVRDLVLTRHPDPSRVWILPNRYDKTVMRPLPNAKFSDLDAEFPWRYRLLCVGRLSRQKNQDTLIRALAQLGPDYGCVFVGRNDPAPLQKLAAERGVGAQCRFVESVRNDRLAHYYNWADAMVTPSRWEGFGIVFIEALASGAVVVTSNTRPMSEYIAHEANGLLVNAWEDPNALAETVRRACGDKALARRLREAGPSSVARFERAEVDALEIRYYQRILAESRRGLLSSGRARGALGRFAFRTKKRPAFDEKTLLDQCARGALEWARRHSVRGAGIVHSPRHNKPYPEVSGYFIPTLLALGERKLSTQYARWLLSIQNADGSWNGFDCEQAYTFDVGQILKGLGAIREAVETDNGNVWDLDRKTLENAFLRGCDWLLTQISESGAVSTPNREALRLPGGKTVPDAFHLYALEPLQKAGEWFERAGYYTERVRRAVAYYQNDANLGAFDTLSHFHAYIIEALADLGDMRLARQAMHEIAARQKPDGSVPAYPDADWVCSTGLAQYAVIWLKLGERERAERAVLWLCAHQESNGGFRGSYGDGADYFPDTEISWAVKYFLDACSRLELRTSEKINSVQGTGFSLPTSQQPEGCTLNAPFPHSFSRSRIEKGK